MQDLGSDSRSEEGSTNTGEYLEACDLLFERGLLILCRINNNNSPVLINIKKGMTFFEQWCDDHEETGNFIIKNMEDSLNGFKQITLISHFYLINFSLSRKLIKSYTEKVFGLAGMINNYETVI